MRFQTLPFGVVAICTTAVSVVLTAWDCVGDQDGLYDGSKQSSPVDLLNLSVEELMAVPVEVVSTPSRFSQSSREAPSSVSVVTSDEIKALGYRTLADILAGVRGFYVDYDRNWAYLGVRGFSRPSDWNSRVLFLVDGHRANDNIFGSTLIGREFVLDTDLIERVEVVRGPTSSLYGSSAFFGVVNVIPKRAADLQTAEVSGEIGSWETYRGRFTCAGVVTNAEIQFVISGSFYESEGREKIYFEEFDSPDTNNGFAEHLDYERAGNVYANVTWRDFSLTAAYTSREKGVPTASYETLFNDPRYQTIDRRGYLSLKWAHEFGPETAAMTRVYLDEYRFRADYPYGPETAPSDLGMMLDDDLGQTVGGEFQLTHHWKEHVLTVGGEMRDHFRQNQATYWVSPREVLLDDRRSQVDGGAYAEGDFALLRSLRASVGVRYDYYETFGGTANPRFGLVWGPFDQTTLKLLYGSAYRAPNVFELYYLADDAIPNPDLQPEDIQTWEVVWEQDLARGLRLTLSGYYYRLEDMICPTDTIPYTFYNTGEAGGGGGEVEVEWRTAGGFRARTSYCVQRVEDEKTGDSLPNSPLHMAKAQFILPLWSDKVFTGVELQYIGEVKTLPGRETTRAGDYCVANWTLFSQRIVKGLEISASVYNLFDTDYAHPAGTGHIQDLIWQDGRSFRIKATYRF